MPLGDPNRTGPNQDINDPTTLIEVGYEFNRISENLGNMLAKSDSQDPDATGPKILDITIPLKLNDGTTLDFNTENIEKIDDDFIYNTDLWSTGTLVTYINLAEIFREYWNTLNNVLDDLNNTNTFDIFDIDPSLSGVSGSLGGRLYVETISSFSPSESFSEPVWSGDGPTNYNYQTYPQLLSEVLTLETTLNELFNTEINEQYYYYNEFIAGYQPNFPIPELDDVSYSSFIAISLRQLFPIIHPFLFLQIPNFTEDIITVNYEAIANYARSTSPSAPGFGTSDEEQASVSVIVKIGDYNLYSSATTLIDDQDLDVNLFPLPQTASLSASLIDSFDIPPGKSAFIEMTSFSFGSVVLRSDFPTSFSSNNTLRIFYSQDDKSITEANSFNYP